MKFLIAFLAIFLTGQYLPYHQQIVDKYSFMYRKDIIVSMVSKAGYANGIKNCGITSKRTTATGCTYLLKNGTPYLLEVSSDPKWKSRFERDMLHEIYHFTTANGDEIKAEKYAENMILWRNSL